MDLPSFFLPQIFAGMTLDEFKTSMSSFLKYLRMSKKWEWKISPVSRSHIIIRE
jgi:hypothetical protein